MIEFLLKKLINKKSLVFYCLAIFFAQGSFAQTASNSIQITTSNLRQLYACGGVDTFKITLTNISSSNIIDANVRLKMPQGFVYQDSSVFGSGVTQQKLIGNDSVVFTIPTLTALGGTISFYFEAKASCDILNFIQNAGAANIKNRVEAFWGSNTFFNRITSGAIQVLVPSVSINVISNQNYSSTTDPSFTFTRTIRITNGGNGYILPSALKYFDNNATNIKVLNISPALSNVVLNNGDTTVVTFSAQDIISHSLNADGDSLFEQNEYFEITETIQVTGCTNLISNLSAMWGCNNNFCISTTNNNQTSASVTLPNLFPSLSISSNLQRLYKNKCFNSKRYVRQQRFVVKNTGNGIATNIILNPSVVGASLNVSTTYATWLDTSSFKLRFNNAVSTIKTSPLAVSFPITSGLAFISGKPKYAQASIKINELAPGDSVEITFNMMDTIRPNSFCGQHDTWGGVALQSSTYQNFCNTVTYSIAPGTGGNVGFTIFAMNYTNNVVPSDIQSGKAYDFSLENFVLMSFSDFTTNDKGVIALALKFQAGLSWNGNINQVGFKGPTGSQWNPYKFYQNADSVIFYWRLSDEPIDFISTTPTFSFKVITNCVGTTGGTKFIFYAWNLNTDTTCLNNHIFHLRCGSLNASLHCSVPCATGGLAFEDFEIGRTNFGAADNDNNGMPDGVIDLQKVRTDRYMMGDTIALKYKGQINIGSVTGFNYGYVSASFQTSGFLPVKSKVKIVDAFTGFPYIFNNVPITYSNATVAGYSYKNFQIDFSPATLQSYGLPSGYQFKQDDSIIIEMYLQCTYNPGQATTAVSESNEFYIATVPHPTTPAQKYQCDGYAGTLTNYGIRAFGPSCGSCNATTINSCGSTTVTGSFFVAVGGGSTNFNGGNAFPYEYRPWAYQKTIAYQLPIGYEYIGAVANFFHTGGSGVTLNYTYNLPAPTKIGDTLYFNLDSLYDVNGGTLPISDDGWRANYNIVLQPTCETPNGLTQLNNWLSEFKFNKTTVDTSFWGASDNLFTEYGFFGSTKSIHGPLENIGSSITYLQPVLRLSSPFLVTDALTNPIAIDFSVANQSGNSAAENVWVSTKNLPVGMSIKSIIDKVTGLPLIKTNDIYKIGNMPTNGLKNYQLILNFSSCNIDSLKLIVGWNCGGYPISFATKKCYSDSLTLRIFPKQAELQLVASNIASTQLCAIDTFTIDVVNPQIANAQNIEVYVVLPQGMNIQPNQSGFSYPYNANFISIKNPDTVKGSYNVFKWTIDSTVNTFLDSIGLPGLAAQPLNNKFKLRFAVNTDCNFISGTTIGYSIIANSPCGTEVNKFIAPSNAINIIGANKPYDVAIYLQAPNGYNSCKLSNNNLITVKLQISGGGTTGIGDKFYFDAPLGSSYISSSFIAGHNQPNNSTPITNNNFGVSRFEWNLPQGVVTGDSITWSFRMALPNHLPCGLFAINAKTVAPTTPIFCSTLPPPNQTCSILTLTGSQDSVIENTFPSLTFIKFKATSKPDCVSNAEKIYYSATILNTSNTAVNPGSIINIKVYADVDFNQEVSAPDSLLSSHIYAGGLSFFQSFTLIDSILLGNGMPCQLIASVDTSTICLCQGTNYTVANIELKNAGIDKATCSNVPISIGDCGIAGYSYSWTSNGAPSISNTSNPFVTIQNNTASVNQYVYYVTTNRGNSCFSTDTVVVQINPSNVTAGSDLAACKGSFKTLQGNTTVAGSTIIWSNGNLIDNQNIATPIVNTDTVRTINFTITALSPLGCTATDQMVFTVLPTPNISITTAADTVCYLQSTLLAPNAPTAKTISWVLLGNAFSNSLTPILVTPNQGDNLFVAAIIDSNACVASDTILIYANKPPVANTLMSNMCEDQVLLNTNIYTSVNDVETDSNIITILVSPKHGVLQSLGNYKYNYTPVSNFNGVDTAIYVACNQKCTANCDTGIWIISICSLPDAPIAVADSATTAMNALKNIAVLTNDYSPDGTVFSIQSFTSPKHGIIFINANGTIDYTPTTNYFGRDTFTYTICDPNGLLCTTTKVYLKIGVGNIAPIAVADFDTTKINQQIKITALQNDTDPDNNKIKITTIVNPANGHATLFNDTITYTPNANFIGVDSFTYTICDTSTLLPKVLCASAKIYVVVQSNNLIAAINDTLTSVEDSLINISILSNDQLLAGQPYTIFIVNQPSSGIAITNVNGTIDYMSLGGYNGIETFSYAVCYNNINICDTADVAIDILPKNNAPIANDDVASTALNTNVNIAVLSNDFDPDFSNTFPEGNIISASLPATVLQPKHGTVLINGSFVVNYQPNNGFSGFDSLEYVICDNGTPTLCDTAKIFIAINSNNPTANFDRDTTLENIPVTISVSANDSAYGNNVWTYIAQNPQHGAVLMNLNKTITYTPHQGFSGNDYFIYNYCILNTNICDTAIVLVHVNGINNKIFAANDVISISKVGSSGTTLQSVAANDIDNDSNILPEGNITTATVSFDTTLAKPKNGTIVLLAGKFTWTPKAGFGKQGKVDSFQYVICDNGFPNYCDTAWVFVYVGSCSLTADAGLNQTICIGNSINIGGSPTTGIGGSGVYLYNWLASSVNTISAVANPQVTPYTTTKYFVTVTDGTGCFATDSVTVTVANVLNFAFNTDSVFCANDTAIRLIATPTGGTFTGQGIQTIGTKIYFNPTIVATETPITISYTYFSGGCKFEISHSMLVHASPIANAGNDVTICPEQGIHSAQLFATGGLRYSWSPKTGLNDSTIANPIASPTTTTTYIVKVSNFNCTDIDTMVVTVCNTGIPQVVANNDYVFTTVENPVVIVVLDNDNSSINMNDSISVSLSSTPLNGTISFIGNSFEYIPNNGFVGIDSFDYMLCDSFGLNTYCDLGTVYITVGPRAIDDAIANIDCSETNIDILKNDVYGDELNTKSFKIISAPQHGIGLIKNKILYYQPDTGYVGTDMLQYELTVNGLSSTAFVALNIDCKTDCKFAEGLSPNNDGKNDVFKIDCALQYPNNDIIIYNRWGNVVYKASPYKNNWDGTYQNQHLPDGTYFFIFNYNDDEQEPYQGFLIIHQ